MRALTYYLSEWPYILTISIAVYLSFEYWRFPDLTIESSFTAGMVSTYLAFSSQHDSLALLILLMILFPAGYALSTWLLAFANLPPLFAGLLVMLGAYTVNFLANGGEVSKGGFLNEAKLPGFLRTGSWNTLEKFFLLYIALSILIIIILHLFSKSKLAIKLHLSRRANDPLVPVAAGIKYYPHLFICMIIYNLVSFIGGVGFALSNDISGVSFLGAITPGLACMFIVRGFKEYVSVPSKTRSRAEGLNKLTSLALRGSDSLTFILIVLVILSGVITLMRFWVRDWAKGQMGLLNAYTAIGTFVVWALISGVAKLMGKRIRYGKANDY